MGEGRERGGGRTFLKNKFPSGGGKTILEHFWYDTIPLGSS